MSICISIIIPFYNGEAYYKQLLQSLKKAIVHTASKSIDFEIITIIDSVNTVEQDIRTVLEDAFSKVSHVRLILHKNEVNLGVAGSRNVGLSLAHGTHFHIIDQDDEVSEQLYSFVRDALDKKDFILVNGLVYYTNTKFNPHRLFYLTPKLNAEHILTNEFIRSPGQIIFSRRILGQTRFPEPKLNKGTDDRFFWIKLFLNNSEIKTQYINQPLYIAHIHDENYSSDSLNLRKSSLENWDILRRECDLSKYEKLIERNILSLRYSAGEQMALKPKLRGLINRSKYYLEPNKIIRYFFKRIKW